MLKNLILVAGLSAVLVSPVYAENEKACDFLWPLATEISWFEASTSAEVASSGTLPELPQDKAIALALKPVSEADLPVKPTSTPKPGDDKKFGGVVTIGTFAEAGVYQVAISDSGWLDVIQNGKPLEAIAHTGSHDCTKLRKSVRFEVGEGPVSIQVSGVPANTIKIAVRPAAD
jgi:hypothetical protein